MWCLKGNFASSSLDNSRVAMATRGRLRTKESSEKYRLPTSDDPASKKNHLWRTCLLFNCENVGKWWVLWERTYFNAKHTNVLNRLLLSLNISFTLLAVALNSSTTRDLSATTINSEMKRKKERKENHKLQTTFNSSHNCIPNVISSTTGLFSLETDQKELDKRGGQSSTA